MSYKFKYYLIFSFLVFIPTLLWAQVGLSPYSSKGIGELTHSELIQNAGMGNIGISHYDNRYLNNMNPALLTKNHLSVFSFGFFYGGKTISTTEQASKSQDGGLSYLAFAFPVISNRWTASAGLMPLSKVSYNVLSINEVENTNVLVANTQTGSGSISQVYFSNGIQLTKNFSIGLKFSYLFGSILKEENLAILDNTVSYTNSYIKQTSISGFSVEGGIHYSNKITSKGHLNIGLIYRPDLKAKTNYYSFFEKKSLNGFTLFTDTLTETTTKITLPGTIGLGISYNIGKKIAIGTDVRLENWSKFRNVNGANEFLQNSFSIGLGAAFTPDFVNVENYFSRITYRAGFKYSKMPVTLNNYQLNDFGINFGLSLPVSISSIDIALQYGIRGTTNNNLAQENYFKITLGATFNDRWFIKRKYQ